MYILQRPKWSHGKRRGGPDFGCPLSDSKRTSAWGLQRDHEVLSAQMDKSGVY